jgi:hypothetical protein
MLLFWSTASTRGETCLCSSSPLFSSMQDFGDFKSGLPALTIKGFRRRASPVRTLYCSVRQPRPSLFPTIKKPSSDWVHLMGQDGTAMWLARRQSGNSSAATRGKVSDAYTSADDHYRGGTGLWPHPVAPRSLPIQEKEPPDDFQADVIPGRLHFSALINPFLDRRRILSSCSCQQAFLGSLVNRICGCTLAAFRERGASFHVSASPAFVLGSGQPQALTGCKGTLQVLWRSSFS